MKKFLLLFPLIALAACSTPMTRAKGHFAEGLQLKGFDDPHARQAFAKAKELLFDVVQLGGLRDEEKVQPLSLILRIYLEARDRIHAERYMQKAAEYVDPLKNYSGDSAALELIKGAHCERRASHELARIEELDEEQAAMRRDRAVKHLEDGLTHFFSARLEKPDLFIERFIDLLKVRSFNTKAEVYREWKKGGRREFLSKALANYRSALEIVERNDGKLFALDADFASWKGRLRTECERLTAEIER